MQYTELSGTLHFSTKRGWSSGLGAHFYPPPSHFSGSLSCQRGRGRVAHGSPHHFLPAILTCHCLLRLQMEWRRAASFSLFLQHILGERLWLQTLWLLSLLVLRRHFMLCFLLLLLLYLFFIFKAKALTPFKVIKWLNHSLWTIKTLLQFMKEGNVLLHYFISKRTIILSFPINL